MPWWRVGSVVYFVCVRYVFIDYCVLVMFCMMDLQLTVPFCFVIEDGRRILAERSGLVLAICGTI